MKNCAHIQAPCFTKYLYKLSILTRIHKFVFFIHYLSINHKFCSILSWNSNSEWDSNHWQPNQKCMCIKKTIHFLVGYIILNTSFKEVSFWESIWNPTITHKLIKRKRKDEGTALQKEGMKGNYMKNSRRDPHTIRMPVNDYYHSFC